MTSKPPADRLAPGERRQFNRRKIQAVLEIDWGSAMLTGPVRDIGPRGLFVQVLPPLWLNATFAARLLVDPPLRLNCRVRRVEPNAGFAVEFDLPDEDGRARLDSLLASLPSA